MDDDCEPYPWDFRRCDGLATMYECERCGRLLFNTDECARHRAGLFLSRCARRRLAQRALSLFGRGE